MTDGTLAWADMGEVYDRIRFGDDIYDFVKGREAFADKLKSYFPNETKAIDQYIVEVRHAARGARNFCGESITAGTVSHCWLFHAQRLS